MRMFGKLAIAAGATAAALLIAPAANASDAGLPALPGLTGATEATDSARLIPALSIVNQLLGGLGTGVSGGGLPSIGG